MLEPKDTVDLLNILEKRGFNNEQLRIVHFKPDETITTHRNYAMSISSFNKNGRNHTVCKRLKFIAKHLHAIEKTEDFTVLAKVAKNEFMMPNSKT